MKDPISDNQFLEQSGIVNSEVSLELVKNIRQALADFAGAPRMDPRFILPSDHVESDLGIHHFDSLDLVDLAASIENDGLRLQYDDYQMIAEINNRNGTVKELTVLIVDVLSRQAGS